MNLRPSGYEPDELPDCSTPQWQERDVTGMDSVLQGPFFALQAALLQHLQAEGPEPARQDAEAEYGQAVQAQYDAGIGAGL